MLRKIALAALFVFMLAITNAQTLKTPQPSPTQTIRQDFGIGFIELSYSRPGIKGRKIFGDLVPFGSVWRTGANNATTINFSDSITIGGVKLAPGKYGLLSIPNKDQWTLIISRQLNVTNPTAYKPENDAVRVSVKPVVTKDNYETLTMQFANVKPTSTDLQIAWENTMVTLPINTDFDRKVMEDINLALKDTRPYFQAGMYYLDNNRDLPQAISWFDKAIEQNPKAYWVLHQKANALAKQGKKQDAKATAQQSLDLARSEKNEDYVKLNEKLLELLAK